MLAPLALSLGIGLLPGSVRGGLAAVLERSIFLPFRFAVGWGPRSLEAEHSLSDQIRKFASRSWESDDLLEGKAETLRLQRLLGFRRRAGIDLVPASVVGRGRDRFGSLLVIETGEGEHVDLGMPLLTPDGLVGRVESRVGSRFRVECLNHLNMAVSVLDQRSREGGILKWNPESGGLFVDGIPAQADWQKGDRLVTSGLGTDFPRGILVGWVTGRRSQQAGLLESIVVRPAAVASRVEEAFVLIPSSAPSTAEGPVAGIRSSGAESAGSDPVPDVSALFPTEASGDRNALPISTPNRGPGPAPVP